MNNKTLGIILIGIAIVLFIVIFSFNQKINNEAEKSCSCQDNFGHLSCPHANQNSWQSYLGVIFSSIIVALALYLIFFEKSQKEIVSTLNKQKQLTNIEEKFNILLMGLSEDEQNVIKAIRNQDGITQQTLRLRTGLHKSKLSIIISDLIKKNLITKQPKGKTNQIFLKIDF